GFGIRDAVLAALSLTDRHIHCGPRSGSAGCERSDRIEAERRDGPAGGRANPDHGEQCGSEPYWWIGRDGVGICRADTFRDQRAAATSAVSQQSVESKGG